LIFFGCGLDTGALVPLPGADGGGPEGGSGVRDGGRMDDGGRRDGGGMDGGSEIADGGDADAGCEPGAIDPLVAIALPAPADVAVDGDLGDFGGAVFFDVSTSTFVSTSGIGGPAGAADLSARFAILYARGALYVAVEVTDDIQTNGGADALIWDGDSVQLALDMAANGGTSYDATDDFEYGWALTTAGLEAHRWTAPAGAATAMEVYTVRRSGASTVYEVRLSASDLGVLGFDAGMRVRISVLVNESDAALREGYLEWGSGVGMVKNPSLFRDLELRPCM
jgi:hypothetical protein